MKKDTKRFEIIEHTADVGIQVYGSNLKDLFESAAIGLFSLIIDRGKIQASKSVVIDLKEDNQEELLVAWLNELLFQLSTRLFIPKEFNIDKITENSISAHLQGESFDQSRHEITSEIKAATYHELAIKKIEGGYEARVILDT
ncbi:archease [Thermoproteota archaeon]